MTAIDDIIFSPITPPIDWAHLWRDLDPRNKKAVKLFLDNLTWEAERRPDRYDRAYLDFLAEMNAYVYPRLLAHHIVSVQPLAATRAMIVRLEYEKDQDTVKLQVKNHVIESYHRKVSARAYYDANGNIDYGKQFNEIAREIITELDMNLLLWLRVIPDLPTEKNTFDFKYGILTEEEKVMLPILIHREASKIATKTQRCKGNWAILSPAALAVLEQAPTSAYVKNHSMYEPPMLPEIVQYKGMLNGNIRIFCDPYADDDTPILVGYMGESTIDGGVTYCPYIPVCDDRTIVDPDTFLKMRILATNRGCLERVACSTDHSSQALSYSKNFFGLIGTTGTRILEPL